MVTDDLGVVMSVTGNVAGSLLGFILPGLIGASAPARAAAAWDHGEGESEGSGRGGGAGGSGEKRRDIAGGAASAAYAPMPPPALVAKKTAEGGAAAPLPGVSGLRQLLGVTVGGNIDKQALGHGALVALGAASLVLGVVTAVN